MTPKPVTMWAVVRDGRIQSATICGTKRDAETIYRRMRGERWAVELLKARIRLARVVVAEEGGT